MDGIKKQKPAYCVGRQIDLSEVNMSEKLWTHGRPGVYRAKFHAVEARELTGKRGKEYARLEVRFRISDGPEVGRFVAAWTELDIEEKGFGLSPNWFLSSRIARARGSGLEARIRNALQGVNWILCDRAGNGPLKITGCSWAKSQPMNWLDDEDEDDEEND